MFLTICIIGEEGGRQMQLLCMPGPSKRINADTIIEEARKRGINRCFFPLSSLEDITKEMVEQFVLLRKNGLRVLIPPEVFEQIQELPKKWFVNILGQVLEGK